VTTNLPQDIQSQWFSVTRRMQSVANTGGLALITITVLVDSNGTPRLWLAPTVRKIEPRKSQNEILALLSKNDGNIV